MFGNRQSTPATGNTNLFGTPIPSQPSSTNPSSSGGGLFGVTPSPASTTGSMFGTPSSTPQAGGRFFGTVPSITTTSSTGTGAGGTLFGGSTPTATTTTTSPAPPTGGLFGVASPAAPSAPGAAPAASTTSYPPAGGLFGNFTTPTATSVPGTGGGQFRTASIAPLSTGAPGPLFQGSGATSTTQPSQAKPSVFGNTNSAPPKLFTPSSATAPASTINSQTQGGQQGVLQSAVKVELYNLAQYHKFHELNDALKAEIETAEKYILSEMQKSEALSAAFPEHREMVHSISNDTELLERRLLTTNSLLQSDSAALENLMKHQKEDDQHASLSVRTLDLLRLSHTSRIIQSQQTAAQSTTQASLSTTGPTQVQPGVDAFPPIPTVYSTTTNELDITSNAGIINYFSRISVDMEGRLKQFMESVGEVEASLRSVEVQAARKLASRGVTVDGGAAAPGEGSSEGREDDARRLIIKTLRAFYETMSDVSVRLVDSQQGLRELKDAVSQGGMGRSTRR